MKKYKSKVITSATAKEETLPVQKIRSRFSESDFPQDELEKRQAGILLNGAQTITVNDTGEEYHILSGDKEFFAGVKAGLTEFKARVYRFSERNAEIFTIVEKLRSASGIEGAYLIRKLLDYDWTQEDIADATGKSRSAIANTSRLLNLVPEVVGLIESGKLSAGHARALVCVPKEKQYAFALETIKRNCPVRETERAVKAYITPPEVLKSEKAEREKEEGEYLKSLVARLRTTLRAKVSLIGNAKKGRIYIDYLSTDDLYRFEEYAEIIDKFERGDF